MELKKFKPILGKDAPEDKNQLQFPVIASFKLDGIRAIFHHELGLVSRSLKPIQNKQLNKKFSDLLNYVKENKLIIDGEFYHHDLSFQQITSLVMTQNFNDPSTKVKLSKKDELNLNQFYKIDSYDKGIAKHKFHNPLQFHIFDMIIEDNFTQSFQGRVTEMKMQLEISERIKVVPQLLLESSEELDWYFDEALKSNYEGLIVRNPKGHYKFGRSTEKEGLLLKYKPFVTYDAEIIGVTERFTNTNESFENELGHLTKRNTIDAKESTGLASAFIVKWNDNQLKVSIPGTEEFRANIWSNKDSYIGKMIEFKGMDVGSKDVPRHPVFERFRDDRE